MRSQKNSLMSVRLRHLRPLVVFWAQDTKPEPKRYYIFYLFYLYPSLGIWDLAHFRQRRNIVNTVITLIAIFMFIFQQRSNSLAA